MKKHTEENIKVVVRCRPMNEKEIHDGNQVIECIESTQLNLKHKYGGSETYSTYSFDKVFGPETQQEDMFDDIVKRNIDHVMDGYTCSIFAYGQSGSGKTYTMFGPPRAESYFEGIAQRSVRKIFNHISGCSDAKYKISVSFCEIYKEHLYDLLQEKQNPYAQTPNYNHTPSTLSFAQTPINPHKLKLRRDKVKGIYVAGATESECTDVEDVKRCVSIGIRNRAVRATGMNQNSSRSHAVLTIWVDCVKGPRRTVSKLNLIDLAGSEKWGNSTITGVHMAQIKEMTAINQSLSVLSLCVNTLAQSGHQHVPFRDSKLTYLLKDSLGADGMSLFIMTLSPSSLHASETISTLKFAERVRQVKCIPKLQVVHDGKEALKRAVAEITELKMQLDMARRELRELKKEGGGGTTIPSDHKHHHLGEKCGSGALQPGDGSECLISRSSSSSSTDMAVKMTREALEHSRGAVTDGQNTNMNDDDSKPDHRDVVFSPTTSGDPLVHSIPSIWPVQPLTRSLQCRIHNLPLPIPRILPLFLPLPPSSHPMEVSTVETTHHPIQHA
ncbi:hypothetical protein ADUPG1_008742, partial [Aduncisulcus paluster]